MSDAQKQLARSYAKTFLQPLVERGDSLKKIYGYPCPHAHGTLFTIQVGGQVYYNGKHHRIPPDQLVIKQMEGESCLYLFRIAELFEELGGSPLKMPLFQLSWLGSEAVG